MVRRNKGSKRVMMGSRAGFARTSTEHCVLVLPACWGCLLLQPTLLLLGSLHRFLHMAQLQEGFGSASQQAGESRDVQDRESLLPECSQRAGCSGCHFSPRSLRQGHLPLLPAQAASAGEQGLTATGPSGRGRAGHSSFCLLQGRRAASSGPVPALAVQSFAPDPSEALYKGRDGEQAKGGVSVEPPQGTERSSTSQGHTRRQWQAAGGSWAACPLAQGSALQTAPLLDRSVLSPPQHAGVKGRKNTRACNNKEHNN